MIMVMMRMVMMMNDGDDGERADERAEAGVRVWA